MQKTKGYYHNSRPVYTSRLRVHCCLHRIYIVCMVTVRSTVRMGSIPIFSVRRPVSIDIMINFDGDGGRYGDGTCKQALSTQSK